MAASSVAVKVLRFDISVLKIKTVYTPVKA